jgi:hypothetical protein
MLGDGLRPAFYGLVLGLAASGAVRLIQSMLYGTRPLDLAIFASVAATLLAVAVPAWLVPGLESVPDRSNAGLANRISKTSRVAMLRSLKPGDAHHFWGKFGSFLISRICWMCLSACVEISSIHCQQSITSP